MKHKHHIVPRHAGGSDDPSNLVEVSVVRHAMFHYCNWRLHGRWEDKAAWQLLVENYKNPLHVEGRPVSQETRERLSAALTGNTNGKGAVFTQERRDKISKALTGIKRSDATKKKISESNKRRVVSEETRAKCAAAGKKAKGVSKPKGRTPTNAKGVEIDGVVYASALAAGKEINKCASTILRRCKSKKFPTYKLL